MILSFSILAACILIAVLLFTLPLGYSGKTKLVILLISVFLGLLGVLGKNIFPLWELVLLQVVLALLFSYILNKRIVEPKDETEIVDIEIKPLFNMEELENKARTAPTLDTYYHSSSEVEETSTQNNAEEIVNSTANKTKNIDEPSLQEEALEELIEKVKTGEFNSKIDEDIENEEDFIKEDINLDELIMREDELKSNNEVAATAESEKEIEDDISEILAKSREEIEDITPGTREESRDPSLVVFTENEDDAEQLMKARMELFSELEEEFPHNENKEAFKIDETREQVIAENADNEHLIDEEKTEVLMERSYEALDENDSQKNEPQRVGIQPPIEFDDLEEWYMKRKQKEN